MPKARGQAYREALAAVREVINRIDPIGLIEMGAPEDEYDPEAADLVCLVMRSDAFGEAEVDAVWSRWFGDDYATAYKAGFLSDQTRELHRLQEQFAP